MMERRPALYDTPHLDLPLLRWFLLAVGWRSDALARAFAARAQTGLEYMQLAPWRFASPLCMPGLNGVPTSDPPCHAV